MWNILFVCGEMDIWLLKLVDNLHMLQAKILLEDKGADDKAGIGELCIKSPSLFKGYWKLPKVF